MIENRFSNYPEVLPLSGKTEKLVVMLHGLGSDGDDLIGLVPYVQKEMPACHFISPHAVEAYDMAPYGRQWFSLRDRTPATVMKQVENNAPLLVELIEQKQKSLSLTNKETILLGFSQGSMIGTYITLTAKEPYAAIIAFSGRLIFPAVLVNKLTPFCLIHGREDGVVEVEEAQIAARYLIENNIRHEKLIIDNLSHSIDAQGLEFAIKFLRQHAGI